MQEMSFIFVLAFIYVAFAIIQDIRKREVANWLNFSLIVFALVYRLFYSVFSLNFYFFLYGLLGFACFFILAHIFYYSKLFAGGDAKLLMGLGAVLPYSNFILKNLIFLILFIFLLLVAGSVYSLVYSFILAFKNKKAFSEQFSLQFKKNKKLFYFSFISACFFAVLILVIYNALEISVFPLFVVPLLFLLLPILFFYSKAVEESCMVKSVAVSKLTEGDWLYQDLKIGNKRIKAKWSGLSVKEIKLIKKHKKKIKIKQGIPFTPSFLIALILIVYLLLWNPSWHFVNLF